MILIGQYDSPFVRRVGIALTLYGLPFEHRPWSSFADADKIRPFNPLTRVPTLVLDDGEVLVDSHAMLDYLDQLAGIGRAMYPQTEPARHRALKVAALAAGLADKGVALFYERAMHDTVSDDWTRRCQTQINACIDFLEADRSGRRGDYWFGTDIGHADIMLACALRFIGEALPGQFDMGGRPALAEHCRRCEDLAVFQDISQTFIPPA